MCFPARRQGWERARSIALSTRGNGCHRFSALAGTDCFPKPNTDLNVIYFFFLSPSVLVSLTCFLLVSDGTGPQSWSQLSFCGAERLQGEKLGPRLLLGIRCAGLMTF